MTPVISPWVFYWMPVCDNLSLISVILFFSLSLIVLIASCVWCGNIHYGENDPDVRMSKSILKKLMPFAVIFGLLSCFIPSEKTLTKMILAQNVTYERVETVSDTVTTVYNDIMDLFQESGDSDG